METRHCTTTAAQSTTLLRVIATVIKHDRTRSIIGEKIYRRIMLFVLFIILLCPPSWSRAAHIVICGIQTFPKWTMTYIILLLLLLLLYRICDLGCGGAARVILSDLKITKLNRLAIVVPSDARFFNDDDSIFDGRSLSRSSLMYMRGRRMISIRL